MIRNIANIKTSEPSRPTIVAIGSACLLLGIPLLFALRRLSGAFNSPLPPLLLCLFVLFFAAVIWISRLWWKRNSSEWLAAPRDHRINTSLPFLQTWGPSIGITLALFAFSWPLTRFVDLLAWLPLVVCEVLFFRGMGFLGTLRVAEKTIPVTSSITMKGQANSDAITSAIDRINAPQQANELEIQQFTRIRDTASGAESIFGTMVAEFITNQRSAVLHLTFCPAFANKPEVHAEQIDGPEAAVQITQAFTYGARLEIRLADTPTAPASVVLEYAVNAE